MAWLPPGHIPLPTSRGPAPRLRHHTAPFGCAPVTSPRRRALAPPRWRVPVSGGQWRGPGAGQRPPPTRSPRRRKESGGRAGGCTDVFTGCLYRGRSAAPPGRHRPGPAAALGPGRHKAREEPLPGPHERSAQPRAQPRAPGHEGTEGHGRDTKGHGRDSPGPALRAPCAHSAPAPRS